MFHQDMKRKFSLPNLGTGDKKPRSPVRKLSIHGGLNRRGGRKLSLSLQEVGTARLIFGPNFLSFDGALVNHREETFVIHGAPHSSSPLILSPDDATDSASSKNAARVEFFGHVPHNRLDVPQNDFRTVNVTVIECETGIQYMIKKVILNVKEDGLLCELKSDQVSFETEEALVGNRADVELRTYLNPQLVGRGHTVHVGTMSVSFHTTSTPPDAFAAHSSSEDTIDELYEAGPPDFLK